MTEFVAQVEVNYLRNKTEVARWVERSFNAKPGVSVQEMPPEFLAQQVMKLSEIEPGPFPVEIQMRSKPSDRTEAYLTLLNWMSRMKCHCRGKVVVADL